jgi:acetyltransferase-like isoleucine patch superfamily enzyme
LHRLRGVRIGSDVRIGTDVLIETAFPQWVTIGDHVIVSMRSTIIAHFEGSLPRVKEKTAYVSVRIEDEVFVGPGSMILPNVTIGRGSVVTAGSVVTKSIPPMTMVQGNPARPIAHCEIPLTHRTPLKEFVSKLRPIQ